MRSVCILVNVVLKSIAWGLAIMLGFLTAIVVITTISIAYSISTPAGVGALCLFLGLIYLLFYRS